MDRLEELTALPPISAAARHLDPLLKECNAVLASHQPTLHPFLFRPQSKGEEILNRTPPSQRHRSRVYAGAARARLDPKSPAFHSLVAADGDLRKHHRPS